MTVQPREVSTSSLGLAPVAQRRPLRLVLLGPVSSLFCSERHGVRGAGAQAPWLGGAAAPVHSTGRAGGGHIGMSFSHPRPPHKQWGVAFWVLTCVQKAGAHGCLASGDQSGKMPLPASDQQVTWVLWTLAGPRAHLCQQHCWATVTQAGFPCIRGRFPTIGNGLGKFSAQLAGPGSWARSLVWGISTVGDRALQRPQAAGARTP